MKIISRTITFGSSAHYLKSCVSVTFEGSTDEDLQEAIRQARHDYYILLRKELRLTDKLSSLDFEEVVNYVDSKTK